jgi:hypothetical protein
MSFSHLTGPQIIGISNLSVGDVSDILYSITQIFGQHFHLHLVYYKQQCFEINSLFNTQHFHSSEHIIDSGSPSQFL